MADEGSYSCFVRVQTYSSGAMLMQVAGNQSQITRDFTFFNSSYLYSAFHDANRCKAALQKMLSFYIISGDYGRNVQ